jgi:hypothetical protein
MRGKRSPLWNRSHVICRTLTQKEIALAQSRKNHADAEFKKLQRIQDGNKAMSDYEADAVAVRLKTEKLRALRLARDAAAPVVAPVKKGAKKAKPASPSLSDWLQDRADSGHKN